jgi:hypothetical protein
MRKSFVPIIAALGLVAGSALDAQVTIQNSRASSAGAQDNDPNANPDEVVCKAVAPPLGSRLGARRTCATRAMWREIEAGRPFTRRIIEQIQQALPCDANIGCH